MFGSFWKLAMDSAMLACESQAVIGLRLAKLAAGGTAAQAEVQHMISEKLFAAGEAAVLMATGGTTASVIAGYRSKVRANHRRLSQAATR